MGQRDRRDPAGHKQRPGKNAPTPKAPQNQPGGGNAPQSAIIAWPHGAAAQLSEHPAVEGPVLDLHFLLPLGVATIRMPVGAWVGVQEEVAKVLAEIPEEVERAAAAQRAHAAGIVVAAGNADVAREAATHEQIKKGPTK